MCSTWRAARPALRSCSRRVRLPDRRHRAAAEVRHAARDRVIAAGLEALIDVGRPTPRSHCWSPRAGTRRVCLGATFVWGTMTRRAPALAATVPPGGGVAIGEPFWHEWPLPDAVESHGYVDLAGTVERFERGGLVMTGLVASSEDDWDAYESLHWPPFR